MIISSPTAQVHQYDGVAGLFPVQFSLPVQGIEYTKSVYAAQPKAQDRSKASLLFPRSPAKAPTRLKIVEMCLALEYENVSYRHELHVLLSVRSGPAEVGACGDIPCSRSRLRRPCQAALGSGSIDTLRPRRGAGARWCQGNSALSLEAASGQRPSQRAQRHPPSTAFPSSLSPPAGSWAS